MARAPMAADRSILTDHRLLDAVAGDHLSIAGLQAKAIRLQSGAQQTGAAAERGQIIYEAEWQVQAAWAEPCYVAPAAVPAGNLSALLLRWRSGGQAWYGMGASSGAGAAQAALRSCESFVATLQSTALAAPAAACVLSQAGHGDAFREPTGPAARPADAAAASGMLALSRVCAAEFPGTAWSGVDGGPLQPHASRAALRSLLAVEKTGDAYGRQLLGGLWAAPRLLQGYTPGAGRRVAPVCQESSWLPQGAVIVTGGLGTLGMLMAAWLAGHGSLNGSDIWLLGRSGRTAGDPLPAHLRVAAGSSMLMCNKCDAAAAEEAGAAVSAASSRASRPLQVSAPVGYAGSLAMGCGHALRTWPALHLSAVPRMPCAMFCRL